MQRNEHIRMLFTTGGFLEVAIESWPEWDLNPGPLNSIQTLQPSKLSGHDSSNAGKHKSEDNQNSETFDTEFL